MMCAAVGALLYIGLAFGLAMLTGRIIHAGMSDDDERSGNDGDQSE